jgi:hypothetical protein
LHYVRGVNTHHDLDAGEYTMTLTTHWLGNGDDWAISTNVDDAGSSGKFYISPTVQGALRDNNPSVVPAPYSGPIVWNP